MKSEDIIKKLEETGAILEGHFLLTSGKHSNKYIEKFRILENPETLDIVCCEMAKLFKDNNAKIVLSAAIGGILLCGGVGRHLNLKHIFAERINGELCLRRGFYLPEGINVLIVEDIVTTGGSIFELIELCKQYNANIIGICSLVDRSLIENDFGNYDYQTLLRMPIESWEDEQIPDWLKQIPITSPGRSGKK
tara:strand:+ start:1729 stop:2307 length:579 start_codon:yes stop_codon:yes gene_type:complete